MREIQKKKNEDENRGSSEKTEKTCAFIEYVKPSLMIAAIGLKKKNNECRAINLMRPSSGIPKKKNYATPAQW